MVNLIIPRYGLRFLQFRFGEAVPNLPNAMVASSKEFTMIGIPRCIKELASISIPIDEEFSGAEPLFSQIDLFCVVIDEDIICVLANEDRIVVASNRIALSFGFWIAQTFCEIFPSQFWAQFSRPFQQIKRR
jgi:hypothetical protein